MKEIRGEHKMRREKKILIRRIGILLVGSLLLAGCGSADKSGDGADTAQGEEQTTQGEENGVAQDGSQSASGEQTDEQETAQQKTLIPGREKGDAIAEDEEAIYVFGNDRIDRIEKESGVGRIIWQSEDYEDSPDAYAGGCGLLLENRLYFLQDLWIEGDEKLRLATVRTDGKDYKILKDWNSLQKKIYYWDGILYIGMNWSGAGTKGIALYEDGAIEEVDVRGEGMLYQKVSAKYSEFSDRVYRETEPVTIAEMKEELGFFLLYDRDIKLCKIDAESGEEELLSVDGDLQGWNKEYLLLEKSSEENGSEYDEWYLADMETQEERLLFTCRKNRYVFGMDDDFAYVGSLNYDEGKAESQEAEVNDFIYERIALDTGEAETLFIQHGVEGMHSYYVWNSYRPEIHQGYIYYADWEDYQLYLRRIPMNGTMPAKEETLGAAFYDSGIGQVGRLETYCRKFYSETVPDTVLAELDWCGLVIDERFPGAEKINGMLRDMRNQALAAAETEYIWREEEITEFEEENIPPFYYYMDSSQVSEVSYFDGSTYVSFCQEGYVYMGGVHEIPYWKGFTFNLQTGELLTLEDLVENSEEELKEIVTKCFEQTMNQNPGELWGDVEEVYKKTDDSSPFYLTEDGIKFYYEAGELAGYMEGVQAVTVPYEEFEMKIPVENLVP